MQLGGARLELELKLSLYTSYIENLTDVLIPFFDEKMNKAEKTFEEKKNVMNKEFNAHDINEDALYTRSKRNHRFLFRELNLLLNRNDYLKSSLFGEDTPEEKK